MLHKQATMAVLPVVERRREAVLLAELRAAGVSVASVARNNAVTAPGEALRVDVQGLSRLEAYRIRELANEGSCVSLRVDLPGDSRANARLFERFCLQLQALLCSNGVSPGGIGLEVYGGHIAPQAAWLIRERTLGLGTLFIRVDRRCPQPVWLQLWQLREVPQVVSVVPALVQSPCALLSSEPTKVMLPVIALRVPAGSAWLPLAIDLAGFTDSNGSLQLAALERALQTCVSIGDQLLDELSWKGAAERHDVWFNRRLAIDIRGLGTIARRNGMAPDCAADRKELHNLLRELRDKVRKYSADLAMQHGIVPALQKCDPLPFLPPGSCRNDWHARWQCAVSDAAIRHRNLLAMSPWSLFPADKQADFAYADLLPLLAEVDVIAFHKAIALTRWNVNELKGFHQRTWAILGQENRAGAFAEQI